MIRTAMVRAVRTTCSTSTRVPLMATQHTRLYHDTQYNDIQQIFDATPASGSANMALQRWRETCSTVDNQVSSLPSEDVVKNFDPFRHKNVIQFAEAILQPLKDHTYPEFQVHQTEEWHQANADKNRADIMKLDASLQTDLAELNKALEHTRTEKAGVDTWTVAEALEDHPEWKEKIIEEVDEGNWF